MSDRPPTAANAPERRRPLSSPAARAVLILGAVVVVAAAAVGGVNWWTHGRFVQTTNDAYLQADAVTVAPKVQGYVQAVYVRDNQAVGAGQPLVRIDTANYDAARAQEEAMVAARQADITAAQRQLAQQEAAIQRARAELAGAQATAAYAAGEAKRFAALSAQGVETAERAAQARNQSDQAGAAVRADQAALKGAQDQLATLQAQVGQANAQLGAARAQVRTADINLGDTLIRAAIAGRVGDRTVRVGQFVQPGVRLMSLVPVQDVYLVANYKETQVGRIRIGQAATVKLDALGGQVIDAVVDSFAPGTGAQFALLPPENATGNFTKIVQRVPVRLRLRPPADVRDHLLPGLSATVKIDTTKAPAARASDARA
jgi:membrane fusion protein, multidrug efflux system